MRFFLAGCCVALLAACGQASTTAEYTPDYAYGFTQSCAAQGGASRELCTCIWGKIENNVPRADFDALERLPAAERSVHPLSRQIEGYAVECAASLPQPTSEPAPAP